MDLAEEIDDEETDFWWPIFCGVTITVPLALALRGTKDRELPVYNRNGDPSDPAAAPGPALLPSVFRFLSRSLARERLGNLLYSAVRGLRGLNLLPQAPGAA